jgi:hypothetical protein
MPTVFVQDWSAWGAVVPLVQRSRHAFPRFLPLLSPIRAAALAADFKRGDRTAERVPLKPERPLSTQHVLPHRERCHGY